MLIMLSVSPFKMPLINAENVQLRRSLENILIFCLKITENRSTNFGERSMYIDVLQRCKNINGLNCCDNSFLIKLPP